MRKSSYSISKVWELIKDTVLPVGIFAFIMILLAASLLRLPQRTQLVGVQLAIYPQDISVHSIINGSFQDNWEQWFGDNFYGHTEIVKCHNQIEYSIFHDGIGDWIQGKDGYLFAKGDAYIYAAGSHRSFDKKYIDEYAQKVRDLQTSLDQIGKGFIYLITPVKVEIYPEKLPWYERIIADEYVGRGDGIRECLIKAFDKYGVNYYDMRDDLINQRRETGNDIFLKQGHHWTLNAVAEEAMLLEPKLTEMMPDITFPQLVITDVIDKKFDTDDDILDLQNVFRGKRSSAYCFPCVEYVRKSDASVYVFGTSMSYQISKVLYKDQYDYAFDKMINSKYFTQIEVQDKHGDSIEVYREENKPSDLHIMEHIKESDLIVMESVDFMGVPATHAKFVDYVNQNLGRLFYRLSDNIILYDNDSVGADFEGFYELEEWGRWTEGDTVLVHVLGNELSSASTDISVRISAYSFAANRDADLYFNNEYITTLNVTTTMSDYMVFVPESIIKPEENIIELRLTGDIFSPKELGLSDDARHLGIGISSLVMEGGR